MLMSFGQFGHDLPDRHTRRKAACASVMLALAATLVLAPLAGAQTATDPNDPAFDPFGDAATAESGFGQARRLLSMPLQDLLAEAERLVDAEDWTPAQRHVEAALRRDAENLVARALHAEIVFAFGDLQQARSNFLRVWQSDKSDFRAAFGLGRVYLSDGVFGQAKFYLERAEELAPPDRASEVLRLLARAYAGNRQPLNALETAERAIELDPDDYEVRWTYVTVLTQSQRTEQALAAVDRLVRIAVREWEADRGSRDALVRVVRARQKNLEVLSSALNLLVERGPDGRPTDKPLPGREADAASVIRRSVDLLALNAEATRLLSFHEILDIAAQTIKFEPNNVEHWQTYALLLEETSQTAEAQDAYRKILELQPDNADAQRRLDALVRANGAQSAAAN